MALDTIELFIDEENVEDGISAISFVEHPAIEENWVALSQHKVEFKSIDDEKRIVVGLALVPDKEIYRRRGEYEYNVMFTKETVRKASHLYLKQLNNYFKIQLIEHLQNQINFVILNLKKSRKNI